MIERGRNKQAPRYFTFGKDGDTMPEALIKQIRENGSFNETFVDGDNGQLRAAAASANPFPGIPLVATPLTIKEMFGDALPADEGGTASSSSAASSLDAALDRADLDGIRPGHKTYGKGRAVQLGWHLRHNPLCRPTCPAYQKSARHAESCEHGIILAAKKARGIKL